MPSSLNLQRVRDSPDFVRFWSAATVSGFGTYVTTVAVQILILLTLHQGAGSVGLVSSARWLPYLLFGLVAGVMVERSRRLPLLVTTDLVRCVLLFALPLLALTHRLTLVVLMVFMAVFGLMSLVNDAASQSLVPRIVPGGLLTRANARLDQSDAVAQTTGPALAGWLVSLLTAPLAVLVDAASYLISGLLLVRISVREPPSRRVSLRGVRAEAAQGLRWLYRHRMLRPYALSTHVWFLANAIANTVLAAFALRTVRLSVFGYGVVLAIGGVGGLLGALASTRLGARFGAGRIVIASMIGNAVGWATIALSSAHWSGWVVFGLGELLLGISMGTGNANEMGYKQSVTPDHLQGRSNATMRSINRSMIVVGAPLGGLLGDVIGFRSMLWIAAGGFLCIAIALSRSPYRNARIGDGLPGHPPDGL